MYGAAFAALSSHWRRKPLQLATLILGLALATALWSGVQAINAEARASYARAAETLGEARFTQLLPQSGEGMDQQVFVDLRRVGWLVTPILEGRITLAGDSYQLIGFDPLTAPQGLAPERAEGAADLLAFFTPPGQIMAHPDSARALQGTLPSEIISIETIAPGLLFTDLAVAQSLLGQPRQISRLVLLPDQPGGLPDLASIAPTLQKQAPGSGSDISRLTDSFHLNLTAFGLLSFAVGLFIVHGAIGLAFEQRRDTMRTMRALGLPLHALVTLICLELLALAFLSGAIGMALGYAVAAALLPDVAATLRGLYGAEVDGTLTLRPMWWLAGMAIVLLGTALAASSVVAKLIQMPLLAPAQPRAWARLSERRLLGLSGAAVGLTVLAVALAYFATGLVAGFVLLGALLIAAALALPVLLYATLGSAQRFAKGVVASWFWADTRQQLPGLSLALMALLLALAANIGVGTMVSSFRLTFTGWLDQRLAAELYVTAETEAEAPALQAYLERRADAVLPIWHADARVLGQPAQIYGIADHATYRDNWPMLEKLPDAWDRVAAGTGILINEQLALREGLRPGDTLPLPGGWAAEIVGIFSDYGNPIAQLRLSLPLLAAHHPEASKRRFGVRIAPEQVSALARELRDTFGLPAANIVDQARLKSFSLDIFERTFTVTGALNVLTLSIAGFAILTSLLTLASLRQPQLAPVWALGMTRRQLAGLELTRALILATLTITAAIPVGLILAWVLLSVINVQAFGWRIPMQLFPMDWLRLAALSLLAALLAALWPARRLARTPPAELLKIFANER